MLDLFRRQRGTAPDDPGGPDDLLLKSHIFPKFLKRLSARERPALLDLGRLSGGNIEIFARLGCRVQVEDLLAAVDERGSSPEPSPGAPIPATPEVHGVAEASPEPAAPALASASAPGAAQATTADAAPRDAAQRPPGARPTRRIVLPPRMVGRTVATRNAASQAAPYRSPLPSALAYGDESLDALVAWDLLNYYDSESCRKMAAEVARVLKPGGLVFAYFHSRTQTDPERPHRFRIVDEAHLAVESAPGRPMRRHVLQNRDIEKLFTGMRIGELYFLKNGLREMMLEKRPASGATTPVARPRPRFRID